MRNQNCIGDKRCFESGIGAGAPGELGRLISVEEVKLRLRSFESKGKFAAVGKECELAEGSVEARAYALGFTIGWIEAVDATLHVAVLALKGTALSLDEKLQAAAIGRPPQL